jgi:hypothetical protein
MTKYMLEKNYLQYADVLHTSFQSQVIIRAPIFVQYKGSKFGSLMREYN